MSGYFDVQSALELQRLNDYVSLTLIVAVSYDYCLTFSREVTYIWQKPWTKVSTLFLFIRYVGFLSAIWQFLCTRPGEGAIFIIRIAAITHPDTGNSLNEIRRNVIYLFGNWALPIFFLSADMVMILRVYALYNRSKLMLSFLLVIYIVELVIVFVTRALYSDSKYVMVSTLQLVDITVCNTVIGTQTWNKLFITIQFVLSTILCIFVVAQFVKNAFQLYRATRRWDLNKYTRLLVRDGILYFFVTVLNTLIAVLNILDAFPQGGVGEVIAAVTSIPLYNLTSRFVVNIRELYALDTAGRSVRDIDVGFGLSSEGGRDVGGSTTIGSIAFAEVGGSGGSEDDIVEIAVLESGEQL